MMPREVHSAILNRTRELVAEQWHGVFQDDVRPALAKEGIEILCRDELTSAEKDRMDELFAERIFPCSPRLLSIPRIPSLHLGLVDQPCCGCPQLWRLDSPVLRVKVPTMLSRFISLAEGRYVAPRT